MQICAKLHRVEVSPATLSRLIIDVTNCIALRTTAVISFVRHMDIHPQFINAKVNISDFPRGF